MLDGIRPKLLDPRWVDPARVPVVGGPDVIGLDVYGQYLAASSMPLGTGQPVRVGPVDAAELLTVGGKFREIPSLGQLAGDIDAPGIVGTLRAGDWLAGPALRYLVDDLGLTVPLTDALRWEVHRNWLNGFYQFWRDARAALLGQDDLPSRYALAAIKAIPNAFLGGWLRAPRHNHGATLRIDWAWHVITRARMNALRGVAKAPVGPVAMIADTAYFLGMDECAGVEISASRQLGKWKVEKVAPVTPEIVAAHASGRPNKFRDAVNSSHGSKGDAR
jgi:hypothetical protein